MATTDAALSQHDLGAAELDPPSSSWLPLTAGDVAVADVDAKREHGWPGSWFVFLARFISIGMGIGAAGAALGAVIALLAGETSMLGWTLLAAVGLALGCVVQGKLADHVEHFSPWGWWGAVVELSLATLAKVAALVTDPGAIVGSVVGIGIDLAWLRYFWERRRDFDIDLDL